MSAKPVRMELSGQIAVVTIESPPVNALTQEVKDGLDQAFSKLGEDPDLAAVILTGAGDKAFMAGADIKSLVGISSERAGERQRQTRAIFDRIVQCPAPVLAAIEGLALGAGCELAMACDIRVASQRARFGLPEVRLAAMPGAGGTQRLPRLVGVGMAKKMIFTGDMITAEEALRVGLVDHLTDDGQALDRTRSMAETIRSRGLLAVRHAKAAINQGLHLPLEQGLDIEADYYTRTCATWDMQEGITAFLAKRKPEFQGK